MSSTQTSSGVATLSGETSFYVGIILQNILYGVELFLYFKTIQVFLARRGATRGAAIFYPVFSSVMLLLITIWVVTGSIFGQEIWLLNRNYPGGPIAYGMAHATDPYILLGGVGSMILQQMTDGLLVYRCRIVWDSRRAIIIPSILWLATLVLGIAVTWNSITPGIMLFNGNTAKLGLAYYSISVLLHATSTCMICCRFVCHAREVKEYLGEEYASPYFSLVMLFVESALPYTLSGIAFLVSFALGSPMEIAFSRVYTMLTCVAPQLLILRLAEGSAWKKGSIQLPLSVLVFSPDRGDTSSSGRFNGGTEVHLGSLAEHIPSEVGRG